MKVSVLMPAYNHESFVAQAIESVLSQSFSDFELLIGDDASPDGTADVIRSFRDPRIRFFPHGTNRGATFNHLHLLEHAQGEYIALLNSDDLWLPGKLEKQVQYLDAHPDTVMCSCWAEFIDENGTVLDLGSNVFQQPNRSQAEWIEYFYCHGNCICHPGILARRTVYEKLGYYRLSLRQLPDFEMWTRMIHEGEFYIFQEPFVAHRRFVSGGQNTSSPVLDNSIRDVMESYFVLSEYLESLPDELFSAAFHQYFRNPDAKTEAEMCCERFFLLESGRYYMDRIDKQAAIMYFFRHYDKAMAKVLRTKYNYALSDFYKLSCQVDLLDLKRQVFSAPAAAAPAVIPDNTPLPSNPDVFIPYIRTHRLKTLALVFLKPTSRLYLFLQRLHKKRQDKLGI